MIPIKPDRDTVDIDVDDDDVAPGIPGDTPSVPLRRPLPSVPLRGPLPSVPLRGNPQLEAEGWQRRFLAGPDRAEEAVELYTSLGFEVRAEKLRPSDFGPRCGDCALVACRSYVLIYTHKPT